MQRHHQTHTIVLVEAIVVVEDEAKVVANVEDEAKVEVMIIDWVKSEVTKIKLALEVVVEVVEVVEEDKLKKEVEIQLNIMYKFLKTFAFTEAMGMVERFCASSMRNQFSK